MLDNKFLVAIDLDGTLLKDDKTISTESIKFLKEFEMKKLLKMLKVRKIKLA